MAAQANDQRELAIPLMNAINRTFASGLLTAAFPYTDAATFIAAGVAAIPANYTQKRLQQLLFSGPNAEFKVYNSAAMLASTVTAASLAAARTAVQVFNPNASKTQSSAMLGN